MTDLADTAREELLARLTELRPSARTVLDIGGGVTQQGADALHRILAGARIIATCDRLERCGAAPADAGVVRRALTALRRLLPGGAPRVQRLTAMPDRLPLADGSVELVLGHWLAPGADALEGVLAELRRVLAPGGLFLWTTPGLGAATEPLDMHDLGAALARAGFVEPVLDVDRHRAADGTVVESIHAAAFAGGTGRRREGPGDGIAAETVIPLDRLGRRRGS